MTCSSTTPSLCLQAPKIIVWPQAQLHKLGTTKLLQFLVPLGVRVGMCTHYPSQTPLVGLYWVCYCCLGFSPFTTDVSLFVFNSDGNTVYVLVYVDNIILTRNNDKFIATSIAQLESTFSIKDMVDLTFSLSIQVKRSPSGLELSQTQYMHNLLDKAGMCTGKPLLTPITTSVKLHQKDSPTFYDPTLYRHIVGALQYLTLTRLDITFPVIKVCQFMHSL